MGTVFGQSSRTMLKHKRTNIRPLPAPSDAPPKPTAVDAEIARSGGSSVAIEATKERSQASKNITTPSLSQIIEQRTRENGQLRQELLYEQRRHSASMYLLEEVKMGVKSLQQALINFQQIYMEVENEFTEERKLSSITVEST
jgi:hypothetical protein